MVRERSILVAWAFFRTDPSFAGITHLGCAHQAVGNRVYAGSKEQPDVARFMAPGETLSASYL